MNKRNLFAEISEGFDALKLEREREATSHERLPAVTPPSVSRRGSPVRMHGSAEIKTKVKSWL